jgi:hypothetical protein
MPPDQSRK